MSIYEIEELSFNSTTLRSIHDTSGFSVEQVIERLFPLPTQGQAFLTCFKEHAASEQCILPDEPANALIICTKSIAELGKELGFSHDTTQKYVAILQALGLLRKRAFMGQIAFVLLPGIYLPPSNLEANLDYLLQKSKSKKSRSKFHNLVIEVKQRCLVYGLIGQDFTGTLWQLQALVQPPTGISRRKIEQRLAQAEHLISTLMTQAFTAPAATGKVVPPNLPSSSPNLPELPERKDGVGYERTSETTRQETTKQRKNEVPSPNLASQTLLKDSGSQEEVRKSTQTGEAGRFVQSSAAANLPQLLSRVDASLQGLSLESSQTGSLDRFPEGHTAQNLPSSPRQIDSPLPAQNREAIRTTDPGRFPDGHTTPNLSKSPKQVDSSLSARRGESIQSSSSGRFSDGHDTKNLSGSPRQVDSPVAAQRSESIRQSRSGRFSTSESPGNPPVSPTLVDSQGFVNVNVSNIIKNNINVNVEVVASFMCRLFSEPESKRGIYSKLFREGYNQAETVLAAALFALVHYHRDGTITNPAAVFIARCKAYHAQGVPEEAKQLLVEYGNLTYQQLLDKAKQPAPLAMKQPSMPAHTVLPGLITPATLPPIPQPTDLKPGVPLKSGGGMTRKDALQLKSQIAHNRRFGLCQTGIAPLSDGTYAVLVDDTISGERLRQVAVYSATEWQERQQEICETLFASPGRSLLANRPIRAYDWKKPREKNL